MSADNYIQFQEVTVHHLDTKPTKEWWAWDCRMSAEYIYHNNELYIIQIDSNTGNGKVYRQNKNIFVTEEDFDNWVDTFDVLEYGVVNTEDIEIYRTS